MQLPDDSIGITDILAYRECPRKFHFGMKRHVGVGEQSDVARQEANLYGSVWARSYGSAIHDCIQGVEEGLSDEEAIAAAFQKYAKFLEPGDHEGLAADLDIYRARDFPGTRVVASEDELRVPLMRHKGKQIYFRFKLDRLYEILSAPGSFIHVDYKSSRHAKSKKEVREDLQLWAYNWAIHEFFPEVEQLQQIYDQLKYGQEPTQKGPEARAKIKTWLIDQATAILEDDDFQDDGLLPFQLNQWCEWCPILESCGVVEQLTDFSLVTIAAMAPTEKVGRATVTKLDQAPIEEYVEKLAPIKQARGILKRVDESITGLLKDMPAERRGTLGYDLRPRKATQFTSQAIAELHERLGPSRFYALVGVTKTALEEALADEPELLGWALSLGVESEGSPVLQKVATE